MFNKVNSKAKTISPLRTVALSFLAVILCGTFFLMLPISSRSGEFTPFLDSLFTATSATCVTGLIIYDTYLYWSTFGQIVIISLIQIGGLGLVTLTAFFNIIIGKKMGFRGMDLAKESINTDSFANVRNMLLTIMTVTFSVEFLGALILMFTFVPKYGFKGIYISIFLAISAFCNAGFDILGFEGEFVSLTNYVSSPAVFIPIAILIIVGGFGFVVWREIYFYKRNGRLMTLHSKIVIAMTTILIISGTIAFCAFEWNNPNTMGKLSTIDKIGAGFFQSVSCRTAGFNTIDQATLTPLSKMFSIGLMFIGAAPASTGGGIKVTTIAVIIMTVVSVIKGCDDTVIFHRTVDRKAVYRALSLTLLALLLVVTCSLLINQIFNPELDGLDVVFESVSAFGTVGLSVGVTAEATALSRIMLILSMYFGRVGPLTLVISLALRSGSNREVLPHGKIIIG